MRTMTPRLRYTVLSALLLIHIALSSGAKTNARPVHEVVNEQARIDDKVFTDTDDLPYRNPLEGNSKQNVRLHAQNQQAMFNAEKMRQHRAQVQRWNKSPLPMDSYVKAYQESQETHQLALEQQQSNQKKTRRAETLKRGIKVIPEVIKITKPQGLPKNKNRSHRSHGSFRYHHYMQPKAYKSVYLSPGPTYDQGVTIKPNGNIGLTSLNTFEDPKLFTSAIPSKTRYVFPKQYSQIESYESAKDINNLNSLLSKSPAAQMSELSSLVNPSNTDPKGILDTPIDLYFYMKEPSKNQANVNEFSYEEMAPTYASAYMPQVKDHIPIKEDVLDIEDPNKEPKIKPFNLQALIASPLPTFETSTKSYENLKLLIPNESYMQEGYNFNKPNEITQILKTTENPFTLSEPVEQYFKTPVTDGDLSERYLHHNANHHGVQHLGEDGTEVSAYGEDSLQYASNYEFGYRVRDLHSGNDFGHHEAKTEGKTSGQYHVLLPDGRLQKVQYSAGPEGFHADISYDHLNSR
ncbi:hypothetical protein ACJJTC_000261 [Scirpophaga incertulas]